MKFSLVILTVLSAAFVQAIEYTTVFDTASSAENCVNIDGAYIKKVSNSYRVSGSVLVLENDRAYSAAIEQNIREVCGKNGEVISQTHT